jgi:hypothetical protein
MIKTDEEVLAILKEVRDDYAQKVKAFDAVIALFEVPAEEPHQELEEEGVKLLTPRQILERILKGTDYNFSGTNFWWFRKDIIKAFEQYVNKYGVSSKSIDTSTSGICINAIKAAVSSGVIMTQGEPRHYQYSWADEINKPGI